MLSRAPSGGKFAVRLVQSWRRDPRFSRGEWGHRDSRAFWRKAGSHSQLAGAEGKIPNTGQPTGGRILGPSSTPLGVAHQPPPSQEKVLGPFWRSIVSLRQPTSPGTPRPPGVRGVGCAGLLESRARPWDLLARVEVAGPADGSWGRDSGPIQRGVGWRAKLLQPGAGPRAYL